MLDVPLSNVIKRDIILMKPKDTVSNAARVMTKDNSNAVVVVDDGEPVGIVSERDILREVVSKEKAIGSNLRINNDFARCYY